MTSQNASTLSIEDREQIYRVSTDDGSNGGTHLHEYVLRGLRENEVRRWSEFCASVFAYKKDPPPAEYFYRHYANDPSTRAPGSSKLIRVAVLGDEIVASCRIFLRTIAGHTATTPETPAGKSLSSSSLHAGGIGEVCTAVEHRRRGLSTKLLENAIAIMEDRTDLRVSSLHAAPTFFPLYESMGYSAPPPSNPAGGNRWSTVEFGWTGSIFRALSNDAPADPLRIRPAEFPGDTDTLRRLHAAYSEQRFAGCILRSTDYWNDYLSKELEGSLWVLESGSRILAWLSLRPAKGGAGDPRRPFEVREFGMDTGLARSLSLSKGFVVGVLAAHAVRGHGTGDGAADETVVSLRLPGFLGDEIRSCERDGGADQESRFRFGWSSSPSVAADTIDRGWMYRSLGSCPVTDGFLGFVRGTNGSTAEHFVWPSDSF